MHHDNAGRSPEHTAHHPGAAADRGTDNTPGGAPQLRPTVIAAGTALLTIFFAIGDYLPFWPDALSLNGISHAMSAHGSALLTIVLFPVFLWSLAFVLCAAYLVHNTSFNIPGSTVADAVVNIWLAWSVGAANLVLMSIAGISYDAWTVVLTVASAALASTISGFHLRALLRNGASFRHGPWGVPESRPTT